MQNGAFDPVGSAPGALPVSGSAPRRSVLPGLGVIGILLAGVALGLLATDLVLDRGWDPGAVRIGPWVANPRIGTPAIDPYALARLARTGEVPLAANEGIAFTAVTDDTGYRLLRSCTYRLSGPVPAARFWTLGVVDASGQPLDDLARRSGFTSTTVIRDLDGGFSIDTGPQARPGNWLPTPGPGLMSLVLRLYDTPLTADTSALSSATLPTVTRQSCAAADAAATR